jgi:hypothetical protein
MDRGGVSDFAEPLLRVLSRAPAGRRARIVAASSRTHVSKVNGRWQCVLDQSNDDGDTDAACVIELDKMRDVFFHEIVLFGPPNASRLHNGRVLPGWGRQRVDTAQHQPGMLRAAPRRCVGTEECSHTREHERWREGDRTQDFFRRRTPR